MNKLRMEALRSAIVNMFNEHWQYLELGSSQADRVEAYVLKTIKDVFQEREDNIEATKLHNQIRDMDEDLSTALDIMTDKQVKEFIRITENLNR